MNTPSRRTIAFTLVELIVVITILAILGTIAFASFQGVTRYARNSARAADLSLIRSSLELFVSQWGRYPLPTWAEAVTHSGGLVFHRWTFGGATFAAVGTLSKRPLDPLYGVEYTYAVLADDRQYELGSIIENGIMLAAAPGLDTAHAASGDVKAHLSGTFNGQLGVARLTDRTAVVVLASLTTSNTGAADLSTLYASHSFVANQQFSIPFTYASLGLASEPWVFTPQRIEVMTTSGSLLQLSQHLGTPTGQIALLRNLQHAYSGTLNAGTPEIAALLAVDIDGDVGAARTFAQATIENRLGLALGPILSAQTVFAMSGSWGIVGTAHYAWGDMLGFVNFGTTTRPVAVTDVALAWYAWSPSAGWINLRPTLWGVTNTCAGDVGGSGWSEWHGYIDFSGVRIDANGYFHGRAHGANGGSISFDAATVDTRTSRRPRCSEGGALTITTPVANSSLTAPTPTIRGAGAGFWSRVHVTSSTGAWCRAVAGTDGSWSCTIATPLRPGSTTFAATAVTQSGTAAGSTSVLATLR